MEEVYAQGFMCRGELRFFFSSRRRHTRLDCDWSSDVCSSDLGEVSWSENDLVQATARQPGARAWYLLDDEALSDPSIAERVALATTQTDPNELPFAPPNGTRVAVRVKPGITHTIGGLRID